MYIDPNTGGMLFQVLAVLFGAISGMVLFFSGRIRQMFAQIRRGRRGESAQAADSSEDVQSDSE